MFPRGGALPRGLLRKREGHNTQLIHLGLELSHLEKVSHAKNDKRLNKTYHRLGFGLQGPGTAGKLSLCCQCRR